MKYGIHSIGDLHYLFESKTGEGYELNTGIKSGYKIKAPPGKAGICPHNFSEVSLFEGDIFKTLPRMSEPLLSIFLPHPVVKPKFYYLSEHDYYRVGPDLLKNLMQLQCASQNWMFTLLVAGFGNFLDHMEATNLTPMVVMNVNVNRTNRLQDLIQLMQDRSTRNVIFIGSQDIPLSSEILDISQHYTKDLSDFMSKRNNWDEIGKTLLCQRLN